MAELKGKSNVDTIKEHSNSLTFDEKVIKKIAGMAASEIPGILAMSGNFISGITDMLRNTDDSIKGITVEVGKKQTAIDMKVICEYGQNMPLVFDSIVDKVSKTIKEMTGLDVVEVNVHVFDVLTKEEFERQSKKKPSEAPEIPESDPEVPAEPVSRVE